jgi:hypothetical protein
LVEAIAAVHTAYFFILSIKKDMEKNFLGSKIYIYLEKKTSCFSVRENKGIFG